MTHRYENADLAMRRKVEHMPSVKIIQPAHRHVQEMYQAVFKDERLDSAYKLIMAWKHGTSRHRTFLSSNMCNAIDRIYKINGTLVMQFMVSFYDCSSNFVNYIFMPSELISKTEVVSGDPPAAPENGGNNVKKRIAFEGDNPDSHVVIKQGKFCRTFFVQPRLVSFITSMTKFMLSNSEKYIHQRVPNIQTYVRDYDAFIEKKKQERKARKANKVNVSDQMVVT